MSRPMRFDFVSDVACPWCVIGLRGLEVALDRVGDLVAADIHFHPFELNSDMPPGGENAAEHVRRKYGSSPDQVASTRAAMRERAAALGFTMAGGSDSRIYNTFDAHRLLHWGGIAGGQRRLKHALFESYFTHGRDPGDPDVLADAAAAAGLDRAAARAVAMGDAYAAEVRAAELYWRREGVTSVPTIVVDGRFVVNGGHPPEAFERAIRRIAAEPLPQPPAAIGVPG